MQGKLFQVEYFNKKEIHDVVLVLRTKTNNRILTVTETNGKVGFPGGKVKNTDDTIFDAMKREFNEETGNELPKLYNINRFVYKGKHSFTAIYVANTVKTISTTLGSNADGEIVSMHLSTVNDIRSSLNGEPLSSGKPSFTFRDCAKKSTKLLLPYLLSVK
jgi:ADP-ribose pyrophosphatase YjhB (NUDIX family)